MNLKNFFNRNYTQIAVYVIVVAAIILAIKSLIGSVPYFFHMAVDKIGWVLGASKPIILALVFTYLLSPIVDFFEKSFMGVKILKNKEKQCRIFGVAVVALIVITVITAIISILVYSITDQLKVARFDDVVTLINQNVDNINNAYDLVTEKISKSGIDSLQIKEYVQSAANYLLDWMKAVGAKLVTSVTGITSFFTNLLLAFIMTIYFLVDGKMIMHYMRRISAALLNGQAYGKLKGFLREADTVFSGYIRGQCMDAFFMMVMISITLSITGVKFAIVIGIFAGIGNLIPYVGPVVAYAGTTVACLLNGDIHTLVISIIALIVIQLIDGNIIGPKLLSNAVSIHPLIVIISLVFGSAIGGLLGMLLAVPVGALIKVLFMKFIDRRLEAKNMSNLA